MNSTFARFAHQFHFALICYGCSPCSRFTSTLPTRFFSAVCARIPIILQAGLLIQLEEIITSHHIGFVFSDVFELNSISKEAKIDSCLMGIINPLIKNKERIIVTKIKSK